MPPCALGDVAGDGEAEAGAAASPVRAPSTRAKRSKIRSRSAGGDAGAVVGDGEHDAAVVARRGVNATVERGVADGVVGQVADQPGELVGIADDLTGADTAEVDPHPSSARRRRATRSTMSSRSTGSRRGSPRPALVGPRQEQQVVGQALEPDVSSSTLAWVAEQVGLVRVREVDLELGADAGERAAQLVGGVGDEPALPLRRRPRRRSSMSFIVRASRAISSSPGRAPARGGAGHDRPIDGHLGADRLDGPQRAADQPPEHRRASAATTSGIADEPATG